MEEKIAIISHCQEIKYGLEDGVQSYIIYNMKTY